MMKLARWVARHRKPCLIGTYIFWSVVAILYLFAEFPILTIVLVGLFMLFLFVMIIESAPIASLKTEQYAMNDECDPYPMIESISNLLKYQLSESNRTILTVNHCICLQDAGRSQESYDILSRLNIDKPSAVTPTLRITYYMALFDASYGLGKSEEAKLWYNKFITLFNDMKDSREKASILPGIQHAHAYMAFLHGETDKALSILSDIQSPNLRSRVYTRMLIAKALLQKGDFDSAQNHLVFVVQVGNRLSIVQEAFKLLQNP